MELYNKKINEFTDWVNGTNSLTGGIDTIGDNGQALPVSGERIRELLQQKLQKPIFVYRDNTAHLYRIFSSEEAWKIWQTDPDKYGKILEITNFVAPSEYGIDFKLRSKSISYIREGIPGQNGAFIRYDWEVKNDKNQHMAENMSVMYSIKENGQKIPKTKRADQTEVDDDLFEYLSVGTNTIDIDMKGEVSGAEYHGSVTINVVNFNISTTFEYNILQKNLSTLNFGLYATRNVKGPLNFLCKRCYYGSGKFNEDIQEVVDTSINIKSSEENNFNPSAEYKEIGSSDIIEMKAGLHTVQVWGKMEIDSTPFYSNLIYYIFGVGHNGTGLPFDGITLKYEYNNRISLIEPTEFSLNATQYERMTFDWGYIRYVDGKVGNISWYLRDVNTSDEEDKIETFIRTYECSPNELAPTFDYVPTEKTEVGRKTSLVAYRDGVELIELPITIAQSSMAISETTGVDLKLKLSAYGKQNSGTGVTDWEYDEYSTTFTGIKWNEASGWYQNSLRLSGTDERAVINYNPFSGINADTKGATIEIEFESEYVSSSDDEIIRLGGALATEPHISIYPNKASLFVNGNAIITTNYKANERVKLAFIIEPKVMLKEELANVIFIVNNGIAERAAGWKNYESNKFVSNSGNIRIGGTNSGVRVYNIRCYTKALTITNAYDNYVFDSDNKAQICNKNDIYRSGEINIDQCKAKLDVIIIKGNLNSILNRNTTKDGSNTACDIERINIRDTSKNFTVTHGRIRKHGQSTLNYPLTSYKLWTWSSVDEVRPELKINASSDIPFTKNRYQMKDDSIPSNKFVLQANYADSSGVHNGGFLRLIQETWYKAQFKGATGDEYKLRTPPQLFTSNQSISLQEGDTNNTEEVNNIFRGFNAEGKQWKDYFGDTAFPYTIRNAPDSFPCLVFYQNEEAGDTAPKFLGQYVFMDDKKSDYTYGQRSIYKVEDLQSGTNNANDPFCVKRNQSGDSLWNEDNGIKIWDNDKVLRIECLSVNSTLADFRGTIADNSQRAFDNVILGTNENDTSIGWEEDFELVYPEKEEITTKKVFNPTKFIQTVSPFTEWLRWLIGTKGDHQRFRAEAPGHLDLYKLAAYYIFVLRFGLVDSLERNAQIKTYDGVHFHYEPWDMDIALGNRNTGGIAFDPPITRDTMMDSDTAAISGKSRIDTDGDKIADTEVSNWLWDALEAWPKWIEEIVPETAEALFNAGLKYANIIKVLDEDYQNAWCESIYNESGNFKYVVNRQNTDDYGNILPGYNDGWLAWLQGARTTHRHWWLKSSMDYYDAKWGVGEFTQRTMYFGCEMHNVQGTIDITPTSDTYFSFLREATKFGPFPATPLNPLHFDVSIINSGAKVPFLINGANFIKKIDISDIAGGLQVFSVANAYSSEVGPIITEVNIGVPITVEQTNHLEGPQNLKDITIEPGLSLNAIEKLNVRGQRGQKNALDLSFLADARTITELKAAGSGLQTLTSAVGTNYHTLELPDTVTSITFNSTTWNSNNISFWISTPGGVTTRTYEQEMTDEEGHIIYEQDGVTPKMETVTEQVVTSASYDKYDLNNVNIQTSIPKNLLSVRFTGTTGKNACARQFVVDWINSIIAWGTQDWNNHVEDTEGFETLDEYLDSLFKMRFLSVENIYWDNETIPGLSYEQLTWIAKFNNIDYSQEYNPHPNVANFARGYIRLTDATPLTGIQTAYLSTWFGNGVFILNSGGLVVDQANNYTAITVGQNAYIENGEIYLKEGTYARISATKFRLQTTLAETSFFLASPGSQTQATSLVYPAGSGSVACAIESNQYGNDYVYYLRTYPNITGRDYDVDLISGSSRVTIHIKALDYPEDVFLSIEGDRKTTNSGSNSGFYKYYKTANTFVVGQQTGNLVVGLQFLEKGNYVNTPKNKEIKIEYVKFKLYKNGVVCSEFEDYKDYDFFTQSETTKQTFVDSSSTDLSYTKGFRITNDTYKYFIPLYLQNDIGSTPMVYTVETLFKLGGLIKTISQNFIIVKDQIVAPEGTALWGLINNAYYQQFNENFDRGDFYRSLCYILTKEIGIGGQFQREASWVNVADNLNLLTTLVFNGDSILLHLPNITGINLNNSIIPSVSEGIQNINLNNITKLKTFSIENCSNLSQDIDLSNNHDIVEVDASGTTINVILPTNPKVTKYELGTPTSVNISNPTVLTPSGVVVDSYANITSLDIVNIPPSDNDRQTYKMFDKIMKNIGTMISYRWLQIDTGNILTPETDPNVGSNNNITSPIYVSPGDTIEITSTTNSNLYKLMAEYDSNGNYLRHSQFSGSKTIGSNTAYILGHVYAPQTVKVINTTTGNIIFDWRA